MEEITLHAQNIKCGGCVSTIQEGLATVDGVSEVQVEIDSGKVSIQGSQLDGVQIRAKLAELGYPEA